MRRAPWLVLPLLLVGCQDRITSMEPDAFDKWAETTFAADASARYELWEEYAYDQTSGEKTCFAWEVEATLDGKAQTKECDALSRNDCMSFNGDKGKGEYGHCHACDFEFDAAGTVEMRTRVVETECKPTSEVFEGRPKLDNLNLWVVKTGR